MAAKDPYKYFRVEAQELLEGLNQGVLLLEKNGPSREVVAQLLRHAHTLKGAARVVRLTGIADLVHSLEEILAPWREGGLQAPAGMAQELLGLLDAVAALLGGLGTGVNQQPQPAQLLERRPESVRLEVSELDGVLECLREASGALSSLRRQVPAKALETVEQLERELELAHDRAGRMRLLPAAGLFDFLERSCRDASQALDKKVHFEARGKESRMDAPVLSALQEALQHVVRNAVAHGIEEPASRVAAGKPAEGKVWVELKLEAGKALIRCGDDGRGLDLAAISKAAKLKGWWGGQTPAMDEAAALDLLLKGGLSTAARVTELSGRGLGLDVLRETVQSLKGSLKVINRPGLGLELQISVPASISAYTALAVEFGGNTALIPFSAVQSALRLEASSLSHTAQGQSVLAGDEALPYLPLSDCFGPAALPGQFRTRAAVLLRASAGRVALGVDRILGVREVVVLPLPEMTPSSGLACGASLDAAGEPCMVLDPELLVEAVGSRSSSAEGSSQALPQRLPVLVIDDSLTTRMLEKSILETAGYEVETASSAEEGLGLAQVRNYGLILVDVEMPGMNGFEFLEHVARDARLRLIPAILVTSRGSAEDRLRGAAAGAKDYIVKGEFDQAKLLSRIAELLS